MRGYGYKDVRLEYVVQMADSFGQVYEPSGSIKDTKSLD
jgi:hypothetical protein